MTSKKTLAKWMTNKAAREVKEVHHSFLFIDGEQACGCALGKAAVGKYGDARRAREAIEQAAKAICKLTLVSEYSGVLLAFRKILGVPIHLVRQINTAHHCEVYTTNQIARRLRAGKKIL